MGDPGRELTNGCQAFLMLGTLGHLEPEHTGADLPGDGLSQRGFFGQPGALPRTGEQHPTDAPALVHNREGHRTGNARALQGHGDGLRRPVRLGGGGVLDRSRLVEPRVAAFQGQAHVAG